MYMHFSIAIIRILFRYENINYQTLKNRDVLYLPDIVNRFGCPYLYDFLLFLLINPHASVVTLLFYISLCLLSYAAKYEYDQNIS